VQLVENPAGVVVRVRDVAHLRPPAFSRGFVSFLWGLFLGAYIWLGSVAVGVAGGTAFIIGAVAGFLIFLYVRLYGTEEAAVSESPARASALSGQAEEQQTR
jgi:uncharacterized membrane protein YhiD involved in acid resistance